MLFFLIILTTYGGVNYYVYETIAAGLGRDSWIVASLVTAFALAPFSLRLTEGKLPHWLLKWKAVIGFNWMGVCWLFTSCTVLIRILGLFVPAISAREALTIGGGLAVLATIWGVAAAQNVKEKRLEVLSPKFNDKDKNAFRVIQISDIHLGWGSSQAFMRKLVERINHLKPDLIVSTGDLFDSDLENLKEFVEIVKRFSAVEGKLAVTGNHEVYSNLGKAIELTVESQFDLLRFGSKDIGDWLTIAGVDDPEVPARLDFDQKETEMLKSIDSHRFVLLLKHRPSTARKSIGKFDLQLSGHTHGGQIFPFKWLTKLQYRARTGLSQLSLESFLYLSRGTGTWGPKIRFLAPAEFTVFDFKKGERFEIRHTLN